MWDLDTTIIEDGGSGKSLRQELRRSGKFRQLFAIRPLTDKVIRLEAQTVKLEGGSFLLPVNADCLAGFERECEGFPIGHDEQVDSMSQFLYWTSLRKSEFNIWNRPRLAVRSSRLYAKLKQYS